MSLADLSIPCCFKEKNSDSEHKESNSGVNYTADEYWRLRWEGKCEGTGTVMFANSPMKIEDIHSLSPYGQIVGGHVTPIDHMYFEPKDRSLSISVPIYFLYKWFLKQCNVYIDVFASGNLKFLK